MKIQWEGKVGPAAIIGVLGMIVQAGVVVWVGATIYTKTVDKIEAQGTKIEEVAKGSDRRFETVHTALAKTQTDQATTESRMGRVETAIVYVSQQVQRVEAKLDGTAPPAPAIAAPTVGPSKP